MSTLWKLGGAVCNQPGVLDRLAAHYAQQRPAWILMHGAGPQLDAALRAVDGEPAKLAGLRITSPAGAQVVCETMDAVGKQLTQLLVERGVPARHVPAASAWLHGVPKTVAGGDLGRVGTPTGADVGRIHGILADGEVPVLSPAAWDGTGPLNINADEAAAATAGHVGCASLHLVTDVPHVRAGQDPVLRLDPGSARRLIQDGHAQGGMIPKLDAACAALDAGVPSVRIGDVETILAGGATLLTASVEVAASEGT